MKDGIRVESHGPVAGPGTRVWVVKDGKEVEISNHVTNVEAYLKPGELAKVRLEVILLEWKSEATLEDLAIKWFGKRWRLTQRIRRKAREITTHSMKTREYL